MMLPAAGPKRFGPVIVFVCLACGFGGAPCLGAEPSAASPPEPYAAALAAGLPPTERLVARLDRPRNMNHAYLAAACLAHADGADAAGDAPAAERYRAQARALVDDVLGATARTDDFFLVLPLAEAVRGLRTAGGAEPARAATEAAFAREAGRIYVARERADHNRAMLNAAGLALAAGLLPAAPEAPAWRAEADAVWAIWAEQGDTTENATNYNPLYLCALVRLAEETGRVDALRTDARAHATWRRFRDQLSPGGYMPGYGDSPPWLRHAAWAAAFEAGAWLFDDPSLRAAAERMSPLDTPARMSTAEGFAGAGDLFWLGHAARWRARAGAGGEPGRAGPAGAAAWTQERLAGTARPWADKVILRPGDGAAFAMLDLIGARAEHGQPEWGALDYLEWRGVPLLHGTGYNNRSPEHANLLLARPLGEEFPGPAAPFVVNEWMEARLPTAVLVPRAREDEPTARRVTLEKITLRVEHRVAEQRLEVAALETVRRRGGRGRDLLGAAADWRGARKVERTGDGLAFVSAPVQGAAARRVSFIGRVADLGLDVDEEPALRVRWRLADASQGWARPLILRVHGRDADGRAVLADWQVPLPQLWPRVGPARAETRGAAGFAELRFDDWFEPGAAWRRRIAASARGAFLVRDEWLAGPGGRGLRVGVLWHLWARPRGVAGAWIAAPDAALGARSERLVVLMPGAVGTKTAGREFGVWRPSLWGDYAPHTVYAAEAAGAEAHRFMTALVPCADDAEADAVAASARWTTDGVEFSRAAGSAVERLELREDGG